MRGKGTGLTWQSSRGSTHTAMLYPKGHSARAQFLGSSWDSLIREEEFPGGKWIIFIPIRKHQSA